jgi:hypothetical protein
MKYQNIREEELKNKVGQEYFLDYDSTKIVGNIDFTVVPKIKDRNQKKMFDDHSLLWAEAKTGNFDVISMFAQLILTIGKERTFDKNLPPAFLGVFDFKKIAYVPYEKIQHLFFKNDFNWKVTPSNHETKEFKEIHLLIQTILKSDKYEYEFGKDDKELKFFIKNNIAKATESGKINIDKNNFVPIYLRWLDVIKPLINFDFSEGKKQNILDHDFYFADLFVDDHDTVSSNDDTSLNDELFVVFKTGHYEISKENLKSLFNATIDIKDIKSYEQFWKRYKRPPIKEFQDYIIERRDLLVPQDIRERKGAFFTPRQWVELSQNYLTDVFGENWQEEYYIWDCAAGTGNLLAGLTNKYNIWASTYDQPDVNVMHERIDHGANLLKDHVFQFDFLNDDFSNLPIPLQDIINNPEKRKKLIIYINPPYAEAGTKSKIAGQGVSKANVSFNNKIYEKYHIKFGTAARQLFAQFFIRIFTEIPDCAMAHFSTLKFIQSQNYLKYRQHFRAEFKKGFVVPANTFDNVKGQFPIGFFIWDLKSNKQIHTIESDVYDLEGYKGIKKIYTYEKGRFMIDWLRAYFDKESTIIGYLRVNGPDVQNNIGVFLTNTPSENDVRMHFIQKITQVNIFQMAIYFSVRHSINPWWLNDSDQFAYPTKKYESDNEFKNDCLVYAIFSGQNKITCNGAINYWIPFSEREINAREKFESNFLSNLIQGKLKSNGKKDLFGEAQLTAPLEFSKIAQSVLDAGKALWSYYHNQPNCNVNGSLYDIREYFKGRDEKGKMKTKSNDLKYTELDNDLKEKIRILAKKIEPKVYEYEFLK